MVATVFKCLFCNHEASVVCKLNLNSMIGELVCRICDAKFETQINTLTDPIDVFSEWLDEANELQEQEQRRMQEGLPTEAAGYVGDGADYLPERPDDMGEEADAEIVGENEDEALQSNDEDTESKDQLTHERSDAPGKTAVDKIETYDADDDL